MFQLAGQSLKNVLASCTCYSVPRMHGGSRANHQTSKGNSPSFGVASSVVAASLRHTHRCEFQHNHPMWRCGAQSPRPLPPLPHFSIPRFRMQTRQRPMQSIAGRNTSTMLPFPKGHCYSVVAESHWTWYGLMWPHDLT